MQVTRQQIVEMLLRWQTGQLSASELHTWAEERYIPGTVDFGDWEHDQWSVACEVLGALDQLPMNLILPADVPIYLAFLASPPGDFEPAYAKFVATLNQINFAARRQALSSNRFYQRYCV